MRLDKTSVGSKIFIQKENVYEKAVFFDGAIDSSFV